MPGRPDPARRRASAVARRPRTGRVRPSAGVPDRDHLDVVAREQRETGRDSVGWPTTTTRSTCATEVGRRAAGGRCGSRRAPVRQPAGRLGQQRPAGLLGEDAGRRTGVVAGDHDGAGHRRSSRTSLAAPEPRRAAPDAGRSGPRPAARRRRAAAARRAGTLRCTGPGRPLRAGASADASDRRAVCAVGRRRRRRRRSVRRRGRPGRWSGWRRCRAARAGRSAVSTTQRHPGVRGLQHGRVQVGHRGAGGADDRDRPARALARPRARKAGGPLVDARVQPQPAGPVRGVAARTRAGRCASRARAPPRRTPPRTSSSTSARASAVGGGSRGRSCRTAGQPAAPVGHPVRVGRPRPAPRRSDLRPAPPAASPSTGSSGSVDHVVGEQRDGGQPARVGQLGQRGGQRHAGGDADRDSTRAGDHAPAGRCPRRSAGRPAPRRAAAP